jgi:hypothetical protein
VYPEVSELATWSENIEWLSFCHYVNLYRYFVSQSSEFCRHNPLCCFSTSVYCCCCCLFRYRLSPKTFGYTLVLSYQNTTQVTNQKTTTRIFTLKMEAARSTETIVLYHNTKRRHNSEDHVKNLRPEDGGIKIHRNDGILPQYTASQPRRPQFEYPPP